MTAFRRLAALFALALAAAGCAAPGAGEDRTVYHFSEGLVQATNGLRNIGNHLDVNPQARIVVVAHSLGVDFLLREARDRNGNRYEDLVEQLKARGVRFDVCEITLRNRNLKREQFVADASYVASGVAELSRLQRAGHAYIKP